jgi:hypothetical protein
MDWSSNDILKVIIIAIGLPAIILRLNWARLDPLRIARVAFIVTWLINVVTFAVVTFYLANFTSYPQPVKEAITTWSASIHLHGAISMLGTWFVMQKIRVWGAE